MVINWRYTHNTSLNENAFIILYLPKTHSWHYIFEKYIDYTIFIENTYIILYLSKTHTWYYIYLNWIHGTYIYDTLRNTSIDIFIENSFTSGSTNLETLIFLYIQI